MGNQSSANKFKQKSGDVLSPDKDPLHPANFPKTNSMRKNSDASSSGAGAKSEIIPTLTRRFSGLSPKNGNKHRRNVSEGPQPFLQNSPSHLNDLSTLSTYSQGFKVSDSDSDVSLAMPPDMTLDTRDLSDNSEPSSATVRQSAKEKKDLAQASEIKPWLYLGGAEVAKNKEYLRSIGITHVLNCAHTVCENYHEKDFKYVRPIDLTDASKEEIGNFMLQAIADIESVREDRGKIFVHCQLGSSRSATLVIAYLMWLEGLDAQTAFTEVRKKRSIVMPNLGFMTQLVAFKKRLDWRPRTPTLHRVAPHSGTDGALVVKLVVRADTKEPVVPRVEHLDPRGAFLLHSPPDRTMYLWVGPDVGLQAEEDAESRRTNTTASVSAAMKRTSTPAARETYEQAGKRFGRIMCKYEKAFRDENGHPCQLVVVPTDQSAVLALADGADQNSCAAKFWKTLGESVGTKNSIESLRASRPTKEWNEVEDSQTVTYIDSSSSVQFAVTNLNSSDRSLAGNRMSERSLQEMPTTLKGSDRTLQEVTRPLTPSARSLISDEGATPDRNSRPRQATIESPEKN